LPGEAPKALLKGLGSKGTGFQGKRLGVGKMRGVAPRGFGGAWTGCARGRGRRDRDRGGEKGVPPHSTTHFNQWLNYD